MNPIDIISIIMRNAVIAIFQNSVFFSFSACSSSFCVVFFVFLSSASCFFVFLSSFSSLFIVLMKSSVNFVCFSLSLISDTVLMTRSIIITIIRAVTALFSSRYVSALVILSLIPVVFCCVSAVVCAVSVIAVMSAVFAVSVVVTVSFVVLLVV